MAPGDDNPISNLFVRWKQHVDHHINTTLNSVLGVPSVVSRSYGAGDADGVTPARSEGSMPPVSGPDPARGSVPAASHQAHLLEGLLMRQWYHWTVLSPYSPFNLQNLPPPTPNDLPGLGSDHPASPGGFADAFEDLLRVGSGHGLTDHQERRLRALDPARRNCDRRVLWLADLRCDKLVASHYPAGSGSREVLGPALLAGASSPTAWLTSLRRRGLYDLTFPSDSEVRSHPWRHPGALAALPPRDPWDVSWQDVADWGFRGFPEALAGLHLGIDSTAGQIDRWFGSPISADERQQQQQQQAGQDGHDRARWPDSEEALFDGIRARRTQEPAAAGREPGNHTSTETTREADGTTTVRTREEEVDDKGNVRRLKIVTRTLDSDGNEIARQTESRYHASFGGSWSWGSGSESDDGQARDDDDSKKGSWFWKK